MASLNANGSRSQAPSFPDPIPGVMPFGTVSLLAGTSGAGKTTLVAEWSARLSQGRTICQHQTNRPNGIYFLGADRRWEQDHQVWFDKAGARDVHVYSLADDDHVPTNLRTDLSGNKALELFEYCLNQLAPVPGALVIVDPLTPLFIGGDLNQQRPVALTLHELTRICRNRSVTILATAYQGKPKADRRERYLRPIDRIAGSGAFAGYSHTQMYVCEPEPPKRVWYTFGWRPRHGEEQEFHFTRDKATGLFIPWASGPADPRIEAILKLFPADGLIISFDDLWDHVQESQITVSRRTLFRIVQELEGSQIERLKRGYYRRIPVH